VTYCWKVLDKNYNFGFDLIVIEGLHTKLWAPKVTKVLGARIPRSGSLGTKCHLDVGLMERHKEYYKGEGGGFTQVRAMVSLVSSRLFVVHPSNKCYNPTLKECEDDTHTPKMGTWESFGTPENSELDCRCQNTLS
jgi:hypothetical protein